MVETTLWIFWFYLIQAFFACVFNGTRTQRGVFDFLRLTFLPYVLLFYKGIRKD